MIKQLPFILFVFWISCIKAQDKPIGDLHFSGFLDVEPLGVSASLERIKACDFLMGVTAIEEVEQEGKTKAIVYGQWQFSYRLDDTELPVGIVQHKYKYEIAEDAIWYHFYDYRHLGESANFKSLGPLSSVWTEEVGAVFSENLYSELLYYISVDWTNAIRLFKKYCLN